MKVKNSDGKIKMFVLIGILFLSLVGAGFYYSNLDSVKISGFAVEGGIPSIPQDLANQIISEIPPESTRDKLVCANEYKTSASRTSCKASDCGSDKYLRCYSSKSLFTRRTYYSEVCQKNYEIKCSENPVCNSGDSEVSRTSCAGMPLFKLTCGNKYTLYVTSSDYAQQNCGRNKFISKYTTKTSWFGRTRYYLTCQKESLTECSENPVCNSGYSEIKKEEC